MVESFVSLPKILESWEADPRLMKNVTARVEVPAREGRYGALPADMRPELAALLRADGIERLYSHQISAWQHVRAGRNVCLLTPTASGKSLCYHLPVLQRVLDEKDARSLYLFPTKALSQDQYMDLHRMIRALDAEIATFTYDGDTPADARAAIRSHGHVVITNPDMLHTGILPHHTKWLKLFENLRYVVIDEVHTYRGVFGSHLANILRRLKRIARFYGAAPQFILCSATIANPLELAEQLVEEPVELIAESGAPTAEKVVYFYNPPVINKELGIRASYLKTAKRLAMSLLRHGVPTIVFALSRLNVELLLKYFRESMAKAKEDPEQVQGYRGGYLPGHRRRIEQGLRAGTVRGVVATNALELGVDIGQLEVCFVAGYPGSVASFWQQSGRAGRRSGSAATVFVARSNPLDQFIVQNPDYFFGQTPEHARIHPDNLFIVVDHVKCAAFELPFDDGESFGALEAADTAQILGYLTQNQVLNHAGGRYHWMERHYPANQVNLRNIPGENFVVIEVESGKILAEVDFKSTQTTLHEHAIYHVDAVQYQVERLDWENHKAYVRKVVPDYFTDAMTYSKVDVLEVSDSRTVGPLLVEWGDVSVTSRVVGFKKIKFHTSENVGFGEVNLPELTMHTSAWWFTIPSGLIEELPYDRADFVDGLVGIAHALHYVCVLALMCDVQDLGRCVGDKSAKWFAVMGQTGQEPRWTADGAAPDDVFEPTLFVYDSYPGGVGFSPKLFEQHEGLVTRARALIATCPCESGCPSCVGPLLHLNERSKEIPLAILDRVIGDRAAPLAPARGVARELHEARERSLH
ncbi:MAG: helicase [Myxococcales bacterium]